MDVNHMDSSCLSAGSVGGVRSWQCGLTWHDRMPRRHMLSQALGDERDDPYVDRSGGPAGHSGSVWACYPNVRRDV